jgi:hypothetical protein
MEVFHQREAALHGRLDRRALGVRQLDVPDIRRDTDARWSVRLHIGT